MSTPREINRLYQACEDVSSQIGNGLPLDGALIAELRASVEAFGIDGQIRTEPEGIDPGAIGSDILSALNDKDFQPDQTSAISAAEFLHRFDVFDSTALAWAKAHAKLAIIHNKTHAILAKED